MKHMHMATILLLLVLAAGPAVASPKPSGPATPAAAPGGLLFIENAGQFDPAARFQVWGGGQTL